LCDGANEAWASCRFSELGVSHGPSRGHRVTSYRNRRVFGRSRRPTIQARFNAGGLATERHRQRQVYGPDRLVAADLLPTRYDRVAADLGAHGEHVERPEQLAPALERAFASRRPACINVDIASIRAPSAS
jgi:thiamine pyrophosphate-dependent acetolactate synthase large subunit-like protein